LAVGCKTPGTCTHEPNVIGAAAGANLLWAESGSYPEDTEEKTEGRRGLTVEDCGKVFAKRNGAFCRGLRGCIQGERPVVLFPAFV